MGLSFQEHHLFQILRRFDQQHLPLDLFLSHYFRSHKALGSKDRKFISESVYGMTKWRALLDHLIGQQQSWERRYAIFRAFQPMNYLYVNSIPLHTRVSFPKELWDRLVAHYGQEKATHLCQVCNTEAPLTIRINPAKTTREALIAQFPEELDPTPCSFSQWGVTFKKRFALFDTPAFREGLFEVQDEGSQLIANLVKPCPGEQVLDYCAGSGGKSLSFAHKLQGQGQIYLHDIRPYALEQGKKRFRRAEIQNIQFLLPDHPQLSRLKKRMHWVLVDAPCSGTGTLRRNPDMKWKFDMAMLKRLVSEQRVIFERALSFLRPGGHIVYATCSILPDENEQQLHHFLKTYGLTMVGDPFVSLPTFGGMDGFFAAVMRA